MVLQLSNVDQETFNQHCHKFGPSSAMMAHAWANVKRLLASVASRCPRAGGGRGQTWLGISGRFFSLFACKMELKTEDEVWRWDRGRCGRCPRAPINLEGGAADPPMPSPRARIRASHVTNRKVELMEFDVFSSRLSRTPPLVPGVGSTRRNYLPGMCLETPQLFYFEFVPPLHSRHLYRVLWILVAFWGFHCLFILGFIVLYFSISCM